MIDTESKRRSVHGYTNTLILPVPDGTIGALDREHATWLYGGILAGAPVIVVVGGIICGTLIRTPYPIGVVSQNGPMGVITDMDLIIGVITQIRTVGDTQECD